jgi:Family of unknown function (DUF5681)
MSQPEADNDALSEQYAETDSPTQTVGYGRPPKHAQFAKGRSGNPNGRPKGVRNFATVIEAELNTKIPINENGKRRSISKREAVAKQLVNKAASGDTKAIPHLLNESRAHEKTDIGRNLDPGQSGADHQVMTGMLERIRRSMAQPGSSSAHSPADGQTPQGGPSDAGTTQPAIERLP